MSLAAGQTGVVERPAKEKHETVGFRFRITLEGFMLLIVILLVGFAAWHSGTNLLYLIFSILIAFYLLHGALLWQNLRALSLNETFPETVTAGQPFEVSIELQNGKHRMTTYSVRVAHYLVNGKKANRMGSVYYPVVPRGSARETFYTCHLDQRGYHRISRSAMSTRYPFGFEERSVVFSIDARVLALPQTYAVNDVASTIPFGFGDQESRVRGTGTELYGLREYVPGEHARHVHWKTSARVQKIMLAEYTRDERRQVVLLLNNSQAQQPAPSVEQDFENAIILTASLARHFLSAGFEVGLITQDGEVPVAQGPTQLLSILRHLAVIELVLHRPLPVLQERVLQVGFDNEPTSAMAWHVIDSRSWEPPTEKVQQGEKK